MPAPQAKFALEFPQGHVFYADSGIYYRPNGGDIGYMVYGERKELFGKQAVIVAANRENGSGDYAVVHEFRNGALIDARLVKRDTTVEGKLADEQTLANLNADLASGALALRRPQDMRPPSVFNVAQFPDGRLLLQMDKDELYLGTPGNFQKLDARKTVQGGNSMYYQMADGTPIALPYGMGGPRHGEPPMFGKQELVYLQTTDRNPATFGLTFPPAPPFLDPFSTPAAAAPAANAAFKPKAPGF